MKKPLSVLVACILAFSLNGQTCIEKISKSQSIINPKSIKNQVEKNRFSKDDKVGRFTQKPGSINNLKTSLAVKYRLDSIIYDKYVDSTSSWVPEERDLLVFNAENQFIQFSYYMWDPEASQWFPGEMTRYSFYPDGKLFQETSFMWDEDSNKWIADDIDEYQYMANGSIAVELDYDVYNGSLQPSYKTDYTYNEDGEALSETETVYDFTGEVWDSNYKNEFTYDAGGNRIQEVYSTWYLDQWMNYMKDDFTYDGSDNKIGRMVYYWNEDSADWINSDKLEYSYDVLGNMIQRINYIRDYSSPDDYSKLQKDEYVYSDGKLSLSVGYLWNSDSSDWMNDYKEELTYDGSGNNTRYAYYEWKGNPGEAYWVATDKDEYTYNNTYTYNDLILPYLEEEAEMFSHMLTNIMDYELNSEQILMQDSYGTLYYTQVGGNVVTNSEIKQARLVIYPNPAENYFNVQLENPTGSEIIELYDMQGRRVLVQTVSVSNIISTENLTEGIYQYRVIQNSKTLTGKIMLK